jgi:pre-mRNA-splicing factor SYF1
MEALSLDITEEDVAYEEDVSNNRYVLKSWLRYLHMKKKAPPAVRNMIYERALSFLPGSYKLWRAYLMERKSQLTNLRIDDRAYDSLINTFDRALAHMHKYPRIWIEYLSFMTSQCKITLTRHAFDRAIKALPITQHNRIWPLYIKFVKNTGVPETTIRVYRRYVKLEPSAIEEYIDYLVQVGQIAEAAKQLARIINDENFSSSQGKSKHDLWMRLSDLASKNPSHVKELKVEAMIRSGLAKFTNEVGKLWTALADYYIRLGNFDKARDIYEEGVNTVMTMRDFNQIWEAYSEFEYDLIKKMMAEMSGDSDDEPDSEDVGEFDLRMAFYEDLIERQAILISDVSIRQNPHNVTEWMKRVELFADNPAKMSETYAKALETIDPLRATGKPHALWIAYAQFWEKLGKLPEARRVYGKAVKVNFKKLDHLASVWCDYVEMELRHENYENARKLVQEATTVPAKPFLIKNDAPTTVRIFKSIRVWSLYADIEESFGTFLTTKAVYDKILDLRIATPMTVINYAAFLKERKYYEESFKAYERGVAVFKFPNALDIWLAYLHDFIERYSGSKIERLRDLFEQACEAAPGNYSAILYMYFAEQEEKYGLARHAMMIFDKATKAVDIDIKPKMFNLYLRRATENFGVTRTRQIFEKAITLLPDKYVKGFCLRYANLEKKLGEVDRTRAIFIHCSQFCPPALHSDFWEEWSNFEVAHGNVDTVKEMFRIKRSVTAQYASITPLITFTKSKADAAKDDMQALEDDAQEEMATVTVTDAVNKDEIDLDDLEGSDDDYISEEEEESGRKQDFVLEQMSVPKAVFGSAPTELLKKNAMKDTKF